MPHGPAASLESETLDTVASNVSTRVGTRRAPFREQGWRWTISNDE
jgi:hypothetical protein